MKYFMFYLIRILMQITIIKKTLFNNSTLLQKFIEIIYRSTFNIMIILKCIFMLINLNKLFASN